MERHFLLCAGVLALWAAALFVPGLGGDFILDDGINILQNHVLRVEVFNVDDFINAALSFHDGNGSRALAMMSFAIDYWRAGGMEAMAFKQTNLLIHAVTVFCVACFFVRLLRLGGVDERHARLGALALALAWGLHPLQVSSVLYVVQRMQTLATLFVVLALWAYLGMRGAQMAGGRGRGQGIAMLVFWALALASKEDAALLPLYLIVLELTVLRFRAVLPDIQRGLKQSYLLIGVLGALAYFFVVVPHYWHWDHYPGRDFSSLERLLTQARVLCLYLGQIVLPWPDNLPFIYDGYAVSRSLWQPWTTLPALLAIAALLAWAFRWRNRRPLFACGVLLFFAGHVMTSNVIALELVFEHRNHFPLVGAVLAIGDLLVLAARRWQVTQATRRAALVAIYTLLAAATWAHAHTWGDSVRLGEKLVALSPESVRAWTQLSGAHFDRYNASKDLSALQRAVEATERALARIEDSPALLSNQVIYKSLLGTVTDRDWERLFAVLRHPTEGGWVYKGLLWNLQNNVYRGFPVDKARVVEVIHLVASHSALPPLDHLRNAVFIFKSPYPEQSLTYFLLFARGVTPEDGNLRRIVAELRAGGHGDWASLMEQVAGKGE